MVLIVVETVEAIVMAFSYILERADEEYLGNRLADEGMPDLLTCFILVLPEAAK